MMLKFTPFMYRGPTLMNPRSKIIMREGIVAGVVWWSDEGSHSFYGGGTQDLLSYRCFRHFSESWLSFSSFLPFNR